MRVLMGCEYTGIGRDAFVAAGHDAYSCDLDPSESDAGPHMQCDVFEAIDALAWDLIILHPDCTHMAVCGNGTWAGTPERRYAENWTLRLWLKATSTAPRVCMENPVSTLATVMREAFGISAQYIQPWQFGHPETKNTGLYLHGLPALEATNNVHAEMMLLPPKQRHRIWHMSKSPTRGKDRSRSYPGIMQAMADQWGTCPA